MYTSLYWCGITSDHICGLLIQEMLVSPQGIDLSVKAERHFVLMVRKPSLVIKHVIALIFNTFPMCWDSVTSTLIQIAIKAADISNPSRLLPLSKCWSEHIMEEFFRQGQLNALTCLTFSHCGCCGGRQSTQ